MTILTNVLFMILFSKITDCAIIEDYQHGETAARPTRKAPPEKKPTRYVGKPYINTTTEPVTTTITAITWAVLREGARNTTTEVTTTSSTTYEYIPDKEATPRIWEPEEPNLNPRPAKQNSTASVPRKNTTKIKAVCEQFKAGAVNFELGKLADVWQTAYYKLPEKVQCFKIHIKKLTEQEKRANELKYGNFSDAVNWKKCNFEIKAASEINRKHFLQGDDDYEGVLDNIIIVEDVYTGSPKMLGESADQWLVAHNLLLMRDCDTGGIVVFTKVPHQPIPAEIQYALKDFNEEYNSGKMACDDEEDSNKSTFDGDDEMEIK